jgi:Integral membrane protein (PIN domain superfamily)
MVLNTRWIFYFCLASYVLLLCGLSLSAGFYNQNALIFFAISITSLLIAWVLCLRKKVNHRLNGSSLTVPLVASVIYTLILYCRPNPFPEFEAVAWRFSTYAFLLGVGGLFGALWIFRRKPKALRLIFFIILCLWTYGGIENLQKLPSPQIDVWWISQCAAGRILRGENPYIEKCYQIAEEGQGPVRLIPYFAYPPFAAVFTAPFYLFLKDVRYGNLFATCLAVLFLFGICDRSGKSTLESVLLCTLFLFHPLGFMILQFSWTESCLIWPLYASVFFLLRGFPKIGAVLGGFFLGAKQYLLPLALVFYSLIKRKSFLLLSFSAFLALLFPFILVSPNVFYHRLVDGVMQVGIREDALSFSVLVFKKVGSPIPVWIPFLVFTALLLIGIKIQEPFFLFVNAALAYFLFFALNKMAFVNYYYFVGSLLILALALFRTQENRVDYYH